MYISASRQANKNLLENDDIKKNISVSTKHLIYSVGCSVRNKITHIHIHYVVYEILSHCSGVI